MAWIIPDGWMYLLAGSGDVAPRLQAFLAVRAVAATMPKALEFCLKVGHIPGHLCILRATHIYHCSLVRRHGVHELNL